jgi:hypothetical protein
MQLSDPNRRDFTKWAAAAMGGLLAGLSVGRVVAVAADEPKMKDPKKPLLLQEPHICRGLNPTCKSEYKGKKNDCAGQAFGPTIKEHKCKGALQRNSILQRNSPFCNDIPQNAGFRTGRGCLQGLRTPVLRLNSVYATGRAAPGRQKFKTIEAVCVGLNDRNHQSRCDLRRREIGTMDQNTYGHARKSAVHHLYAAEIERTAMQCSSNGVVLCLNKHSFGRIEFGPSFEPRWSIAPKFKDRFSFKFADHVFKLISHENLRSFTLFSWKDSAALDYCDLYSVAIVHREFCGVASVNELTNFKQWCVLELQNSRNANECVGQKLHVGMLTESDFHCLAPVLERGHCHV